VSWVPSTSEVLQYFPFPNHFLSLGCQEHNENKQNSEGCETCVQTALDHCDPEPCAQIEKDEEKQERKEKKVIIALFIILTNSRVCNMFQVLIVLR
jgi:hypothetical protein